MVSRHPNAYATHVPVLIGLSHFLKDHVFQRVLEYGAGIYSTPLFLNRDVFPHLDSLVSCENDLEWVKKVEAEPSVGSWNERLTWIVGFDEKPEERFDLVFIDTDTTEHKIQLIRECSKIRYGLTVVHDAEYPPYGEQIDNFHHSYRFVSFNPWTALAWNGLADFVDSRALFELSEVLRKYSDVPPDDVQQWNRIMGAYAR